MPCPLRRTPPGLLLFGALGLDQPGGVAERERAEFVCLGPVQGGSRTGIVSIAVRVDRAHPELVATGLVGPILVDQQRQAFLLVPPPRRPLSGLCGFDGTVGLGHAGVVPGSSCRCLGHPCGERLGGAGRLISPGVAYPCPEGLGLFGRGSVLGADLAPAEPPGGGQPCTRGRLGLNGGEVGRTVRSSAAC